jgi:hypothetical protein
MKHTHKPFGRTARTLGIAALAMVFAMIIVGCDNGNDNTGGDPDPVTKWTVVADSAFGTNDIYAIAYGAGKFVAGGVDGYNNGKMVYSGKLE